MYVDLLQISSWDFPKNQGIKKSEILRLKLLEKLQSEFQFMFFFALVLRAYLDIIFPLLG